MIRLLGTIFAGLLGLAFGSFLNVCLSRWPEGESIVAPRSHCRNCTHTLAWWENIPLFSWLHLRGRCRQCRTWIGWRYPLVEATLGILWAVTAWRYLFPDSILEFASTSSLVALQRSWVEGIGYMIFYWALVALAVLDAENLWLPDWITLPGILLAFAVPCVDFVLFKEPGVGRGFGGLSMVLGTIAAAGLILTIRWIYLAVRRREGLGLGDAKLMALLAAWLGFPLALLSFGIGVLAGALISVVLLAIPSMRKGSDTWALSKLPLGTFLCIGGILSSLWGHQILNAYLRWAGL